MKKFFIITLFFFMLSSCSFAPTYHQPFVPHPVKYKHAGRWLPAKPEKANTVCGPWWTMYDDPILNRLENQVMLANQDLKAALARYDQARAAVAIASADYFPTINGVVNVT